MKACRSCKHWNLPETLRGAIPELARQCGYCERDGVLHDEYPCASARRISG